MTKILHLPLDLARITQGFKLRLGTKILGLAPLPNTKQYGLLVLQPEEGEYRTRVFIQRIPGSKCDKGEVFVGTYPGKTQTLIVFEQTDKFQLMTIMRFQHFKGGFYKLITLAMDVNNPEQMWVVYESEADGKKWIRKAEEFHEEVTWPDGVKRPRFVLAHGSD